MPTNTDYIIGGFQSLGQGVPGLMGEVAKRQAEEAKNRPLHEAFQRYMRSVLSGQMSPQEAAIRAKLEMHQGAGEMGQGAVAPGMQVPTTGPQSPLFGSPPPAAQSMLSPQGLTGAKPTLAPAGDSLMSGPQAMSPASGGLMQGKPMVPPSGSSLLSAPGPTPQPSTPLAQAPERPFTVRDLEDFTNLRGFYQSQQATGREVLKRESVEREGEKGRESRADLTGKRITSAEKIAKMMSSQRDVASQRSFTARMAAIKAMERMSKSRRSTAKDVAVFLEEGRNLRAEKANITRELAAAAQAFGPPSQTAAVLEDARRRLEELNKLEMAYEPIKRQMLERTGLSEDELLAPLMDDGETESIQRSTPLGPER